MLPITTYSYSIVIVHDIPTHTHVHVSMSMHIHTRVGVISKKLKSLTMINKIHVYMYIANIWENYNIL